MIALFQPFLYIFLAVFSLWTSTTVQAAFDNHQFYKKNTYSKDYPASGSVKVSKLLLSAAKNSTQHAIAEASCSNADPVKIVVIGSSTAEGFKVEKKDSWVGRYEAYLEALNPANEVVNLALGGYNTYHLMPTGFSKPNRDTPDPERNITKAISLNPDGIIINLPSNDAAKYDEDTKAYGVQEQLDNFAAMYQTAQDAGIPVWITTTQPRNTLTSIQNDIQEAVRDSIFSIYGLYALDFWTAITEYKNGEPVIKSDLALSDGVHLTPEGHKLLFEEVRGKLVYERIAQLYTSVKSGSYSDADTWNLNTVPGNAALVAIAKGHTVSLSQNINLRFLKLAEDSKLDLKTYQLNLACAWDMQGKLDASQATVVLTGTEEIQINFSSVKNLILNKASGTASLTSDLTIAATLQLTKGNLNLNGYDLILEKPLSLAGGKATSYIQTTNQGDVVYQLNQDVLTKALIFPVGDATHYTPFTLTLQSATMSNASLRMSVTNDAPIEAGTTDLLLSRQWNLRQEGLSSSLYDVAYQYLQEDVDASADQTEANLKVIKYSTDLGWLIGGAVDVNTNTLSAEGINSFSIFSGGNNIEGAKPLPVELLDFQAKATPAGEAYMTWTTASERDNDYFDLERSSDAEHWSAVAQISGSGSSNTLKDYSFTDEYPLHGHSYYRLKQVDFDGKYEYSPVIAFYTALNIPFQVKIGPNPLSATESLLLLVITNLPDTQAQIQMHDMLGRQVLQQVLQPVAGQNEVLLSHALHRGIYMVTVKQGYYVSQQKLWVR